MAPPPPAEETDEIDFYQASGITQAELEGFLEGLAISSNLHDYPLHITLQNDQGDYLADSRVIVRWNGGEQRLLVGRSAVIQVLLEKQKLPGLRLIVPRGLHASEAEDDSAGNGLCARRQVGRCRLEV